MLMKGHLSSSTGVLLMILSLTQLLITFSTEAKAQTAAIEAPEFKVLASLKDNLSLLVDKRVSIHLRSGTTYQGSLKSVGDHFIHLEKMGGKDFFDALIRIEDISAIEVQFRGFKK